MFFIYSVPYFALIDIGSTHSYIEKTVSIDLHLLAECTVSAISMVNLLGQFIWVDKVYRRVPLEIQGVVFLTDSIEYPFGEFDLIMGMDWLV